VIIIPLTYICVNNGVTNCEQWGHNAKKVIYLEKYMVMKGGVMLIF
tara:strand:+ start:426 stop:563 length:138 start_codon:yes stop_codon:yes gene_type:complete